MLQGPNYENHGLIRSNLAKQTQHDTSEGIKQISHYGLQELQKVWTLFSSICWLQWHLW